MVAGKYEPLFDYLSANQDPSIRLTFIEIERILGTGLPDSARCHRQWWANARTSHPYAQSWLRAGYKTSGQPDFASEEVSFVRVAMQEEMRRAWHLRRQSGSIKKRLLPSAQIPGVVRCAPTRQKKPNSPGTGWLSL